MGDNLPRGSPFSASSSNGSSNTILRRSSYASVAAGAAATSALSQQRQSTGPSALSHLMNRTSSQIPAPLPHQSSRHIRVVSYNSDGGMHTGDGAQEGVETSRMAEPPPYSRQYGYFLNTSRYIGLAASDPEAMLIPSYLRSSRYIEQLREAHKAKNAKQRDGHSTHETNGHSLSTSSSSANLHKMAMSHRGMTYEIIEKEPRPAGDGVPPLPSKWNEGDKFSGIRISGEGLHAQFVGPGKTHEHIEAAAVRADHPISPLCGLYYFEVIIVQMGGQGTIGIGFSSSRVSLNRLPGWEPDSWAYHSDDGRSFCCSSTGKDYGPQFDVGDVIGCGINFRTRSAFFTRNGIYLGIAFRDIKGGKLYPSVGMKRPGEAVLVNFGQTGFYFDIDGMMSKEKYELEQQINLMSTANLHPPLDETSLVQELVAQYLAHEGYVEAAEAFAQETRLESSTLKVKGDDHATEPVVREDPDVIHRQEIRMAIIDGDIDKAFKLMDAFYPNVLRENEQIYFRLRCMKFIEMIRQCSELNLIAQGSSTKSTESTNGHDDGGYDDVFDQEMELDDQMAGGGANWDQMETEDTEDAAPVDAEAGLRHINLLQETIKYGQVLRSEFRDDGRKEVKKALEETFSVWAYEDPKKSIVAHLLEPSGRAPVAEELNSAILVSLGKSSTSALERLYQQTEVLIADISEDGGAGAFINVRKDYLQ